MSGKADRRRGEPLLMLVVLLTAWVGTRAIVWERNLVRWPLAPGRCLRA